MLKFEHLPNELLLEILAYCDPKVLFTSLFNLNTRLNILIYTQPLRINLHNYLSQYSLDLYYQSVLCHARDQIYALELSDTYERINYFLSDSSQMSIDLEKRKLILTQVKFLVLHDPKINCLMEIAKYINNIQDLYISLIYRKDFASDSDQELFKSLFEKTSLKRLCLDFYRPMVFEDQIGISTSLTHVSLCYCFLSDLPELLRRTPNIQKLHIRCKNPENVFSNDYDSFDHSLYDRLADCIPYLTHLKLDTMHIPFQEIEILLRQLPQLTKLTFSSCIMENYSDGSNWERIINNYLPNLQKFSLFLDVIYYDDDDIVIDPNQIIESFNGSFWYRWPVVIEYLEKKHLLLYTLPVQNYALSTHLYGLQIRTTLDNNHVNTEKSHYSKLKKLDFVFHENSLVRNLLPSRVYSKLDSLSFSFELNDPRLFETNTILIDLQQSLSASVLLQIKTIHLENPIYPTNFVSNLLRLFPNLTDLYLPASVLDISLILPRVTSLTVTFHATLEYKSAEILRHMAAHFPNITWLYFELIDDHDIYILLPYCLRKLLDLLYINVLVDRDSPDIDQQGFVRWFDDYKQLNGLDDTVQVEFKDDHHRFQITI